MLQGTLQCVASMSLSKVKSIAVYSSYTFQFLEDLFFIDLKVSGYVKGWRAFKTKNGHAVFK